MRLLISINVISSTKEMKERVRISKQASEHGMADILKFKKRKRKMYGNPFKPHCHTFFWFANVRHSACVWPTVLKRGRVTNFVMLMFLTDVQTLSITGVSARRSYVTFGSFSTHFLPRLYNPHPPQKNKIKNAPSKAWSELRNTQGTETERNGETERQKQTEVLSKPGKK